MASQRGLLFGCALVMIASCVPVGDMLPPMAPNRAHRTQWEVKSGLGLVTAKDKLTDDIDLTPGQLAAAAGNLFDEIDTDGSGMISPQELTNALKTRGVLPRASGGPPKPEAEESEASATRSPSQPLASCETASSPTTCAERHCVWANNACAPGKLQAPDVSSLVATPPQETSPAASPADCSSAAGERQCGIITNCFWRIIYPIVDRSHPKGECQHCISNPGRDGRDAQLYCIDATSPPTCVERCGCTWAHGAGVNTGCVLSNHLTIPAGPNTRSSLRDVQANIHNVNAKPHSVPTHDTDMPVHSPRDTAQDRHTVELEEMRAAFNGMDVDGSGAIDLDEVKSALVKLGEPSSPAEVFLACNSLP